MLKPFCQLFKAQHSQPATTNNHSLQIVHLPPHHLPRTNPGPLLLNNNPPHAIHASRTQRRPTTRQHHTLPPRSPPRPNNSNANDLSNSHRRLHGNPRRFHSTRDSCSHLRRGHLTRKDTPRSLPKVWRGHDERTYTPWSHHYYTLPLCITHAPENGFRKDVIEGLFATDGR